MSALSTKTIFEDVPAWPEHAAANPRAVIGGNKPPLEETIPAEFRAALLADRPDFLTKLDELIDAADRAKAVDDETLGRCGDLVKAYRACQSRIDAAHSEVKAPCLKAGRLVDAEKNALTARLSEAKAKVEGIGNAYVAKRDAEARAERERLAAEQRAAAERAAQAERDRIAAEQEAARASAEAANEDEREAARKRAAEAAAAAEQAMAEAALAPALAARLDPVRSDGGATVSGKQEWACEVEDYAAAFRAVKSDPKVKEAIDAAVKRRVRAGQREIKGVRVWPVAKANFR